MDEAERLKRQISKVTAEYSTRKGWKTVWASPRRELLIQDLRNCFYPESLTAIFQAPQLGPMFRRPHGRQRGYLAIQSAFSSSALTRSVFSAADSLQVLDLRETLREPSRAMFDQEVGYVRTDGSVGTTLANVKTATAMLVCRVVESTSFAMPLEYLESIEGFNDFFDVDRLAFGMPECQGSQLVIGILAALQNGLKYAFVFDKRCSALAAEFRRVCACLRKPWHREQCGSLTWQFLASRCDHGLQAYLRERYDVR